MLEAVSHYRIIRKLGEGGMGVVYEAEDARLGRTVAIKMIRETTEEPLARERLWREARSAASVNHPNICQIYDVGELDGAPYLVMELLEGEPLSARIHREAMPLGEAVPVALGVLTALGALHKRGILHRDLKPSNVFLTPHGVKLLDFGLARRTRMAAAVLVGGGGLGEPSLTMPGIVVGTPRYMSPEQLEGEEIDERADLFAVGTMLYEMLAGTPAFGGKTPVEVYHAVLHDKPPALVGTVAIGAVNRIIFRAMAKKREERYEKAEVMAEDLRGVLLAPGAESTVSARPMKRLIVLPFRMLKADAEIDYLSSSLPDAISGSLSGLESLLVRSSLTASRFAGSEVDLKQIASEAEVDAVLTGTLLRTGEMIRVSTQLVETPSGTVVWSHTLQVPMRELFSVEESLTKQVVKSLSLPLTASEEQRLRHDVPANPTAYEFYLRGSQQGPDPEEWLIARDLFQRSVDEDPRYAPAWARLARCHWIIGKFFGDFRDNRGKAERAVQRALDLNPDLPMAHQLIANMDVQLGRPLEAMRRLLARARTQWNEPELFAGLVTACRFCGLLEASLAAHDQARRLDPKVITSVKFTYTFLGDHERALAPMAGDFPFTNSLFLARAGRDAEALESLRGAEMPGHRGMRNALMALLEGRREDAIVEVDRYQPDFVDPEGACTLAMAVARIGAKKQALKTLRQSVEGGFRCFPAFARDPWLDPLRTEPEFRQILVEVEAHQRAAATVFVEEKGDRLLGVEAIH
jgi:non-specific serine/threonine protein kinase